MGRSTLVLSLALVFGLLSAPAQADIFVYHNPDYDFSVSFPDDWRQMNVTDQDQVRIQPMHGDDSAQCYMRVVEDGRLLIYPEKYLQTANALFMDDMFWKHEVLPDHMNARVMRFYAPAGLGPAFATSLQWVWREPTNEWVDQPEDMNPVGLSPIVTDALGTPEMQVQPGSKVMQAMSTAAIYGPYRYRFTCQAEVEDFVKWQPQFSDIFQSIKLESKYNLWPTGYYRNFLED
jgi:hypothetical protein